MRGRGRFSMAAIHNKSTPTSEEVQLRKNVSFNFLFCFFFVILLKISRNFPINYVVLFFFVCFGVVVGPLVCFCEVLQ